jgi:thiol-disulfide isomerase/thioredoxin
MRGTARSVVALLSLAVVLAIAPSALFAGIRKGDRAAEFVAVTTEDGKRFSLKKHKKAVVVLTFGASWCEPCKKELPALEKLAAKYDGKNVIFLAVNIDTDRTKALQFMKKAGLKRVHALYDPKGSTIKSYDPPKMPTTFIISRGIVKHLHGGYSNGDENKIGSVIDAEL